MVEKTLDYQELMYSLSGLSDFRFTFDKSQETRKGNAVCLKMPYKHHTPRNSRTWTRSYNAIRRMLGAKDFGKFLLYADSLGKSWVKLVPVGDKDFENKWVASFDFIKETACFKLRYTVKEESSMKAESKTYHPKFKVGDKVAIIDYSPKDEFSGKKGKITRIIKMLDSGWDKLEDDKDSFYPLYKVTLEDGMKGEFDEGDLKKVHSSTIQITAKSRRMRPKLDLSLLGVPAVLHSQKPSASTFPSAFNAHSRNIWNAILNDQDLMAYIAKKDPLEQWEFVIKEYIAQCKKAGLPIFSERYCEELNSRLSTDFNRLRRKLVDFFQKNEFADGIKMYSVKHEVQKLPTGGFDLYVSAKLRKVDGNRVEKHIACLSNRELWTEQNKEEAIHEFDPLGRFHISSDLVKNGRMAYKIRAPHSPFVSAKSLRDLTENKYFAKAKALWACEIEKQPLIFAKAKGRRKKTLVMF